MERVTEPQDPQEREQAEEQTGLGGRFAPREGAPAAESAATAPAKAREAIFQLEKVQV